MSKLKPLSEQSLKTVSALLLLFPLVLLGSCSNTKETFVPAPVVPIPPQLTADCPLPVIPDELTYGGAILLLADAMKSIADCNHDKRAIREIEAEKIKKIARNRWGNGLKYYAQAGTLGYVIKLHSLS